MAARRFICRYGWLLRIADGKPLALRAGLCALVHVAIVASCILMLISASKTATSSFSGLKVTYLMIHGFAAIVLTHILRVWIWAFLDLATGLYVSLVTYTTLGLGDFVPGSEIRIFASFAAFTGLLTFGLSTAFLVGLPCNSVVSWHCKLILTIIRDGRGIPLSFMLTVEQGLAQE